MQRRGLRILRFDRDSSADIEKKLTNTGYSVSSLGKQVSVKTCYISHAIQMNGLLIVTTAVFLKMICWFIPSLDS